MYDCTGEFSPKKSNRSTFVVPRINIIAGGDYGCAPRRRPTCSNTNHFRYSLVGRYIYIYIGGVRVRSEYTSNPHHPTSTINLNAIGFSVVEHEFVQAAFEINLRLKKMCSTKIHISIMQILKSFYVHLQFVAYESLFQPLTVANINAHMALLFSTWVSTLAAGTKTCRLDFDIGNLMKLRFQFCAFS